MLSIVIPGIEFYDEEKDEIIRTKDQPLQLEHSLISLSKWESKWKQAFLDKAKEQSMEQQLDYIRCMTITRSVDPTIYGCLTESLVKEIYEYINDPMTATTIRDIGSPASRRIITSELIYYWMIEAGIPFECEKWHLNRLLMLIRVCSAESSGGRKMSKRDVARMYAEENARRCRALKTRG